MFSAKNNKKQLLQLSNKGFLYYLFYHLKIPLAAKKGRTMYKVTPFTKKNIKPQKPNFLT